MPPPYTYEQLHAINTAKADFAAAVAGLLPPDAANEMVSLTAALGLAMVEDPDFRALSPELQDKFIWIFGAVVSRGIITWAQEDHLTE